MAGEAQDNVWPLPKFHFEVDWGSVASGLGFQEVSGLDVEAQVIEYRHGNNPVFSTIKMPGLLKTGNVTMKKGVFVADNQFYDWFSQISMNTIERQEVVIKLLDESGAPTMVWTLKNAFPVKITGTDLKSDANEAAIETIEIAYEEIEITMEA
ncbi:MAG: phage tail protein [Bernardetiaceae bacterium]|nr:phage tail protein [Bernardetiaceae bacterium]